MNTGSLQEPTGFIAAMRQPFNVMHSQTESPGVTIAAANKPAQQVCTMFTPHSHALTIACHVVGDVVQEPLTAASLNEYQ